MAAGDHISTLKEAVGMRRFIVGSVATAAIAALQWVSGVPGMSWVSNIPNYAVAIAVAALLLFWWLLSYATQLRKQREPKIKVFLDEKHGGVKLYPSIPPSKWIQVTVHSTTDAPLIDCEARLVNVERRNDDGSVENLLDQPIWCRWDDMEGAEKRRTTIPSGISHGAMLFNAFQGQNSLNPDVDPPKSKLVNEIQKPGKYTLNLKVTAKDAQMCPASFILEWGGSFDKITLKPAPDS
jgi:hypothetical protein